tara:strand:- start:1778 stop:2356 length:579 start_codon:yes stop_codon:yes gene_type:complete
MINDTGYLELILGPMWSGKTTELIKIYNKFKYCNINVLAINYLHDTRYGNNTISTHDKNDIPCLMIKNLKEVSDIKNDILTQIFTEAQVILINEGQFFKDINEWVNISVNKYNKHIYICGLDGDYNRTCFDKFLELIPNCDKVKKYSAICSECKQRPAIFTHRIINNDNQELIGNDIYKPMCRKCYNIINKT